MSSELWNNIPAVKKFQNVQPVQNLLSNATRMEDFFNGKLIKNYLDSIPKDQRGLYPAYPTMSTSTTKLPDLKPTGDMNIQATIEDNFFYQHMFNFALVVILLLQVIVVWAFIWCRLSKYEQNQRNNQPPPYHMREWDVRLPELVPRREADEVENEDEVEQPAVVVAQNRCPQFG